MISNVSKVFENIICNHLQNVCQTSNFLTQNPIAFRKNPNTELAALLTALEKKIYAICVFLDYSDYSFDTLSRSNLFHKLESYDKRCVSLDFLKTYFSNKSQVVCDGSVNSCIRNQDLGVIQCSKTGPLIFDKYFSDFTRVCFRDKTILHADDTVLV